MYGEHADVAIEVEGPSIAACLARAAAALFGLKCAVPAGAQLDRTIDVELQAERPEELLVAWLRELIHRSEADATCFAHFHVASDGRRLHAIARGVATGGAERAGPGVKAITRQTLDLRRLHNAWRARLILDA